MQRKALHFILNYKMIKPITACYFREGLVWLKLIKCDADAHLWNYVPKLTTKYVTFTTKYN